MSEDVAPYSGAIEETAKTTGKALDLVRDGARPIADAYGLIIGDQIHAARHRRLDAITRKTRQILKDRNLSETAEIAEQIAIPLLESRKANRARRCKICGLVSWRMRWIQVAGMTSGPSLSKH